MTGVRDDGGPAFPLALEDTAERPLLEGMSVRQHYATHAPITFEMARRAWGGDLPLTCDATRASFFAVWALLRFEWADAMIAHEQSEKDQS